MSADPVSWEELIECCSRLHTTRTRPQWPGAYGEHREASAVMNVVVKGEPGRIVPTRMHEPGFYLSLDKDDGPTSRDPSWLTGEFRSIVDSGGVVRTDTNGDN